MKNTVELAAEFIHRAAFVDANALLKDECGVEHWQVPYECDYSEGLHGFYPGGGCV